MKPLPTVSPEEAVPSPTVPDDIRKQLLELAKDGVTTVDAARQLGLLARAVMRYFDLLRVAGLVHLRPTPDGREAEWKTGRPPRRST
jgi:predicted ArsR family transcriptional regulator